MYANVLSRILLVVCSGGYIVTFYTYQQLPPRLIGDEWVPHLVMRDNVQASSEEAAITIARQLEVFRRAQGLARFPMVEEV
jgi:hypothetical protein